MKRRNEIDDERVAVFGMFCLDNRLKHKDYSGRNNVEGVSSFTGLTGHKTIPNGKFISASEYLGYSLQVDVAGSRKLKDNEEVREMPCYPTPGYIKVVDGILVIKLSEYL